MKNIHIAILSVLAPICANATLIQLNFTDNNGVSQTAVNGSYWNNMDGQSNVAGDVANLVDEANTGTDISLTWGSLSGFQSNGRGEGGTGAVGSALDGQSTWTAASASADTSAGVTYTADEIYFPWSVIRTYSADNTSSGRDGLMQLTFSSATPMTYAFWVMTSYDHGNPTNATGHFNIGGAYASNAFTGGTTLTLNGAQVQQATDTLLDSSETSPGSVKYSVGRLGSTFDAVFNEVSGKYELTLQAGMGAGSAGVYLNGVTVQAIPEAGTLALVGVALGSLLLFRRRK